MKIRIFIILYLLVIGSYCFADEKEEPIVPVAGLNVYTVESEKDIEALGVFRNLAVEHLTMDNYNGFGLDFHIGELNSIIMGICSDFFVYENNSSNIDMKILANSSIYIGKRFNFNRLFYLQVNHSFDLISLDYEYDSYNIEDGTDSGGIFCPSVNYIFGLNLRILKRLTIFGKMKNYIWYTNPEIEMEVNANMGYYEPEDYKVKVSDEYDKALYSFGIQFKF